MTVTTSQETYERLLEKLISGAFPAGTRLVNRKLATDLGVSVIPVREALGRLASEGLGEHIPGAGTFCRKLSPKDIVKLYTCREQLEAFSIREASKNIQPYQLDRLERVLEESDKLVSELTDAEPGGSEDNRKLWLKLDAAFHETIIEAADNQWLAQAVSGARLLSHVSRSKPRNLDAENCRKTLDEHRNMTDAIRSGDADKAERLMRQHIVFAIDGLLKDMDL